MSNQTLLIGVDAGDFQTIDPMLEAGELPNIQKLIEDGFRGTLSSSIPPWTPTAWTSLTTGKNPGKHGIFDFKIPGTDKLVNATDVQTNTIWDYVTEAGESSIVVNVPVTHPATDIKRVLIPGYLGPEVDDAIAQPEGILDELQQEIGEYRIYKSEKVSDGQSLCEEYLRLLQMRADAMTYLCNEYQWTFAMVQFQRTDTVFHEIPEDQYIESVYRKLDDCIGQLISTIDASNTLVASDHGMGKTGDWDFRINTWLLENGYLETETEGYRAGWEKPTGETNSGKSTDNGSNILSKAAYAASLIGITPRRVEQGLKHFGLDEVAMRIIPNTWLQSALEGGGEGINVRSSKAFCPSGPGLGIICDDEGPRERLLEELSSLRDPDNHRVFEWVREAEDLYDGPAVDLAPDLVAYPKEMSYYLSATLTADTFVENRYTYNHAQDCVLLGSGKDITPVNDDFEADINDIVPTILSLLETPLDEEFDGEPIRAILKDVRIPESQYYDSVNQASSKANKDVVKSRLEDLGYME